MSQGANVRSFDALRDFKVALVAFADDARTILDGVEMEIRRTRNWLERDQLVFWRTQIKRRQEEVAEARTELHRRRLTQMNSDAISDTEQKEALRLAQRRLAEAEDKAERVRRWIPVLEHAIAEYHAQSQPLGDHLAGGFENTLALLERMLDALDAYRNLAAPSAPELPPAEGTPAASEAGPAGVASAADPRGPGDDEAGAAEERAAETEPAEAEPPIAADAAEAAVPRERGEASA